MIYIKEKKQNNDDSKLAVKTYKNQLSGSGNFVCVRDLSLLRYEPTYSSKQ